MCMEREYGKEKTRLFLNEEMRSYLWRRTRELGDELPLKTNFQNYVRYSKGSIVMYALQDYIGEDAVNKGIIRMTLAWPVRPSGNHIQEIARKSRMRMAAAGHQRMCCEGVSVSRF